MARGRSRRAKETGGSLRGRGRAVLGGLTVLLAVGTCAVVVACAGKPLPPPVAPEVALDAGEDTGPPPPPPLYTRLGGKDGVAAIVDAFIDDLVADKRLKKAFAKTKGPRLDHFKAMLQDQICEMAAGGCKYTGKTMPDEHATMKITSAQFDAFVGDFQLALEEKQVSKDDQQQLVDQLNLLKDQIATAK